MEKKIKKHITTRLSKNSRIGIRNASLIAEHLKSNFVEPEHILVGILLNDRALATKVVISMGFNVKELISKVLDSKGIDITVDVNTPKEVRFSEQSREVLRKSFDWSQRLSHVYVGTEHLMLGILESKDTFVVGLVNQGLNSRRFQKHLSEVATYPLGVLAKPNIPGLDSEQGKILDSIGKDLVELARGGKLDPLVGREDELTNVVKILSRRKKNNPVIVGDAGVGKTVLIEGLAQKIADDRVPPSLRDVKIVSLDVEGKGVRLGDELIIIPILLGETEKYKKPHTCDEEFGVIAEVSS